jgi:hypothetical protein
MTGNDRGHAERERKDPEKTSAGVRDPAADKSRPLLWMTGTKDPPIEGEEDDDEPGSPVG